MNEHQMQCALIQWCSIANTAYPHIDKIFAIPNGGQRHVATAVKLKKEGVKKGIPDLFLPVPRHGYHGLFVELKYGGNRPSPPQREFIEFAKNQHYATAVIYSVDQGIKTIQKYYEGKL